MSARSEPRQTLVSGQRRQIPLARGSRQNRGALKDKENYAKAFAASQVSSATIDMNIREAIDKLVNRIDLTKRKPSMS